MLFRLLAEGVDRHAVLAIDWELWVAVSVSCCVASRTVSIRMVTPSDFARL